ncbi:hypothetical protein PG988_006529 [Apiospora saccharicola]
MPPKPLPPLPRPRRPGCGHILCRLSGSIKQLKADVAHGRRRLRQLGTPGYMDPEYDAVHEQLQAHISKTYSIHGMGPEVAALYRYLVDLSQMRMDIVHMDHACTFGQRVTAKWALDHSGLPGWLLTTKEKAYRDVLKTRSELL